MPYSVRCKACSASFAIPDEIWDKRVRGRVATLKCRSCKAEIHVDGTKEGVVQLSVAPPAAPASTPATEVASAPAVAPLPVAAPVAPVVTETAPAPSATTTSPGLSASSTTSAKTSPTPPAVATPAIAIKPAAKAAQDIAAADAGWSLMPPPGELVQVGLSPTPASAPAAPKSAPAPVSAAPTFESVPPISVSPDSVEEVPPDPHLWVVSYGENDDRELSEKQIATELIKGHITLATIVWQEGMDEWLPISGVKVLSKYAPAQKPAPIRQAKPALVSKGGAQPARTATTTASTTSKAGSTVPRQAAQPREKQPSSPFVDAKGAPKGREPEPKSEPKAANLQPSAPEGKTAKGPPPLARASDRSGDGKPHGAGGHAVGGVAGSRVPTDKAAIAATASSSAGQQGGRSPAMNRRPETAGNAPSPWTEEEDAAEEVLTSAPQVDAAIHAHAAEPSPKAATFPTGKAAPSAPAGSTPSQRPGAKTSFRPPKPVETATSTVRRTEESPGKDLITDDDFLAMQRRFPKWALPAAIAGGVALIGLIIYASSSSDEPVRLPVTPTSDTNAAPRDNPANQVQPRHPQPNLDNIPTGAGVTSDEKDFARLFAQKALKTNGTFDAKAAEQATKNVMELAARCRVAPDPAGPARVVVTFSTAGQVLSVQIGSPYSNTATGKCVEKALRTVKTRPFQGEPGRLPLTVPIH